MANAQFRVNRLLKLARRPILFACGDIVSGKIDEGMTLLWPLYGDALTISTPITSVDYLDIDRSKGEVEIALGLDVGEPAEEGEKLIRELFLAGEVLRVAANRSGS